MYNQNSFSQQKYHGNWQCADCGAEITELPFEPDGKRPVRCGDCHRKWKNSNSRDRY